MQGYESEYKVLQPSDDLARRRQYWSLAKGLQKTDGLVTTDYLEGLIEETLTGDLSLTDAKQALSRHYSGVAYGTAAAADMEADIVAARIVGLLETDDFIFSPVLLKSIHKRLFADVLSFDWVGTWRTENIFKEQEILNGRSLRHANYDEIDDYLAFDFAQEKGAVYTLPFDEAQIKRLAEFISAIWQTHPFREGNTRTIATFLIKYLKNMGVEITNEPFAQHSDWFRDALVRHNFADVSKGVNPEPKFLTLFFENILLDANHDLPSCDMTCPPLFEEKVSRGKDGIPVLQ